MRKWLDPLISAWSGITAHKLRASLTILGIVIGVGAVIALMSIGKGAQEQIISRIETLGSNLIIVRPGASMGFGGVRGATGSITTLTQEDANAISEQIDHVSAVAPVNNSNMQLIAGQENTNSQVVGTTPEYANVYNLTIANGSFFSSYDYQRSAKVVVLGSNVAETLFGGSNPVGQNVRMGSLIVKVIGVLESKGETIGSPDDGAIIPLTAMQQTIAVSRNTAGERVISSIYLTVDEATNSEYVDNEITSLLRNRHHLAQTADNDFNITSMEEISSTLSEATSTMTMFLGAIAAISLLVGGIGVMNIMLVSVLERTREIGIRKALGAQENEIWIQFLLEAVLLTFAGGIIGVMLGWLVSFSVSRAGLMTTVVSPDIVILAVCVSAGIGIFFGFYPAWNAARLNPIEALRHE